MAQYFMHLRDDADDVLDDDGVELPNQAAIVSAALASARDMMAADVLKGALDLRYRIDVENVSGVLVHSQAFRDAVKITP